MSISRIHRFQFSVLWKKKENKMSKFFGGGGATLNPPLGSGLARAPSKIKSWVRHCLGEIFWNFSYNLGAQGLGLCGNQALHVMLSRNIR
jgi:hypothetical protein